MSNLYEKTPVPSGAKGDSPEEKTNTLRSRSIARVMDLLSEGPIKGLVGDKKGIYINEVNWENKDGQENFDGLTADFRYGDSTQTAIAGFPAVEREFGMGQTIRKGNVSGFPELSPEIQINDSLVDAVRVTIQVNGLVETQKDGDMVGTSVTIAIDVKNSATAYAEVVRNTISGKTTSAYERAYRITLPKDEGLGNLGAPFKIRVRRITADSEEIKLQNGTQLSHYTEIIDHKLSYPDTAYIGMTFDSKLFKDGVPARQYLIDGLKMQVPSNYYPDGGTIENYVPKSQDFTTANWNKFNVASPVTANNITAPDGELTAQLLVPNATSAQHYITAAAILSGIPVVTDHVTSVYVKQSDASCGGARLEVYAYNGVASFGQYSVAVDFATGVGTYASSNIPANGGRNVGWGVDNVGGGWYRLWLAGYPSSTVSSLLPRLFIQNAAKSESFAGDAVTAYCSVWGFQVHKGTVPYQYLVNTTTAKVTGASAARFYDGVWDGTFKVAFTDNPAWVLYMLLTHPRIGLGQWVKESLVDKWTLYSLAKYCDEMVPNGYGSMEPRFAYNGVIRNRDDAYTVIQSIASMFRGIIYWGAGSTLVAWDAPKDPSVLVTPANVLDGMFDYKGVGWKARHSAALVKWNDPDNLYKDAVEVVEDQDLILQFGWKPIETNAVGCTSRGQAYRWGKWILYTEKYETETVTYKASFDHMIKDGTAVMPGDIIKIMDPSYAGVRNGGRLVRTVRNYLKMSATVNDATWVKTNATVSANTLTRQSILFDQVFEIAATGNHMVRQQVTLTTAGIAAATVHNYCVYLTTPVANAVPKVQLFIGSSAQPTLLTRLNIDLTTGETTTVSNLFGLGNIQVDKFGGVGEPPVWRVSFDFTSLAAPTGGDTLDFRVLALNAGSSDSYLGVATNSFYMTNAQITPGSGVVDSITTTSAIRQAVLLDQAVTILDGSVSTLSVVMPSGKVEDRVVTSPSGSRSLMELASDFSVDPMNGAMWIVSSDEVVPRLFRVLSLREQEDNVVEVTALYHNPDKFAMVEQDLVFETPDFSALDLGPLSPPTNLAYTEYLYVTVGGSVASAVTVSWSPPSNEGRVLSYDVQWKQPGEDWKFHSSHSDVNVTIENIRQGTYSFRVRAVGGIGSPSTWQSIDNAELFGLSAKPPAVTNFNMNAVGDQAFLTWDPPSDPTVGGYAIKMQNVVTGAIWGSGISVIDNLPRSASHVYVPMRFGTYMIKAVSIAGVESDVAAMVISDVAGLGNFNATATVQAEPTWAGTLTNCSVSSNTLVTTPVSGLYPLEATYLTSGYVDLTEIYTNRLTPTISASGQRASYVMSTWGFLNQVEALDGAAENSWSVLIEYASTKVNPATALPGDWTDWRPLIIGDSTARAYKFRLTLISYDTSVQVRVSSFKIVIDMPDRVEGQQGVSVPSTGLNVTYTNAFKATPAVAISVQNAVTGDTFTVSSETRTGFSVLVKNSAGAGKAAVINWVAKGYGKV